MIDLANMEIEALHFLMPTLLNPGRETFSELQSYIIKFRLVNVIPVLKPLTLSSAGTFSFIPFLCFSSQVPSTSRVRREIRLGS